MHFSKNSEATACLGSRSPKSCVERVILTRKRATILVMMQGIHRIIMVFTLLCMTLLGHIPLAYADSIYIEQASLEADSHGGWGLNAQFTFEVKGTLEEALQKGIALYFTTDFKLTRSRWYWFDERTLTLSRTRRLSFQPLTREYRLSSGGLQLRFATLEDALSALRHLSAWRVIPQNRVKTDQPYTASLRMRLNTALMPKPFQIDAINNRDWNLSSDWMYFTFIAPSYAR